eukprot:6345179-Heterocapsa_arctica.AAC.1
MRILDSYLHVVLRGEGHGEVPMRYPQVAAVRTKDRNVRIIHVHVHPFENVIKRVTVELDLPGSAPGADLRGGQHNIDGDPPIVQ